MPQKRLIGPHMRQRRIEIHAIHAEQLHLSIGYWIVARVEHLDGERLKPAQRNLIGLGPRRQLQRAHGCVLGLREHIDALWCGVQASKDHHAIVRVFDFVDLAQIEPP